MKLDVLIMGSSRKQLLEITLESFKKYVVYQNTDVRFLMHEDFAYPSDSEKSVSWAKSQGIHVESSLPKLGLGYAMDKMFKMIESDYVFYLQDDWEFERPVELDRILWTMERNKKVNCITFNKYKNGEDNTGFAYKDYLYDGLPLSIYPGWQFLPGLWRMSKVREQWSPRKIRPEGNFQNSFGDNDKRMNDRPYLEENVGAYFYGLHGEPRYVRHLGGTWRMAEWQVKENNYKPTGVRHWEFMKWQRDRAPWLGKLTARPLNRGVQLNAEGRKQLESQPEYIKEMYK